MPGIFIPEHIVARTDISLPQKVLYGKIISLTTKEGYCFASNEWLGDQLGISGRTIVRWISTFVDKGLLRREIILNEKNQVIERRLYAFVTPTLMTKVPVSPMSNTPVLSPPSTNGVMGGGVTDGVDSIRDKSIENTNTPYNPSPHLTIGESKQDDPLWSEYEELIAFWNLKYGQRRKPVTNDFKNFVYWRKTYDLLDMKFAVVLFKFDSYWGKVTSMSPTLMFRRANKDQTPCDRIGDWLNLQDPQDITLNTIKGDYLILRKWFDDGMPFDETRFKEVMLKLKSYGYEQLYLDGIEHIKEQRART